MRNSRVVASAALAVIMLAGFPALILVLVGLTGAGVIAMGSEAGALTGSAVKLILFVVLLLLGTGVATIAAIVRKPTAPSGVEVTDLVPDLHRLLAELSAIAGTRPPERIVLVDSVNAFARETPRLFGLLSGERELRLGVQLLAGLTVRELSSVLAHELGHYSNRDTTLARIAYRGSVWISAATESVKGTLWWFFLRGYEQLYHRVTLAARRRQEHLADLVAIEATGLTTISDALGRMATIDAAWRTFQQRYLGEDPRRREPVRDVLPSFTAFLRYHAPVPTPLAAPPPSRTRRGAHPSIEERLRALRECWDDPPVAPGVRRDSGVAEGSAGSHRADDRAAGCLVPVHALGDVLDGLLAPTPPGQARESAPDVAIRRHVAVLRGFAAPLSHAVGHLRDRSRPTVADLLGLLESGEAARLAEAARRMVLVPDRADGVTEPLSRRLAALALLCAAEAPGNQWRHRWSDGVRLAGASDIGDLAAAAGRGAADAHRLRQALVAAGVDPAGPLPQSGTGGFTRARPASAAMPVRLNGGLYDLIIHEDALVFWPTAVGAAPRETLRERLSQRLAAVRDGAMSPAAFTVAVGQIVGARRTAKHRLIVELTLRDGTPLHIADVTAGPWWLRAHSRADAAWLDEQRTQSQGALSGIVETRGARSAATDAPSDAVAHPPIPDKLHRAELARRGKTKHHIAWTLSWAGVPLIISGMIGGMDQSPLILLGLIPLVVAAVLLAIGTAQRRRSRRGGPAVSKVRVRGQRTYWYFTIAILVFGTMCPGLVVGLLPRALWEARIAEKSLVVPLLAAVPSALLWGLLIFF